MITLTDPITSASMQFNPERGWRWVDEFAWAPVQQSLTRSLTGAPIVQSSVRVGGRAITLAAGPGDKAPLTGIELERLAAWAGVPGKVLNLVLRGTTRSVVFRHADAPAFDVEPVIDYDDHTPEDLFLATIKLLEI